MSYTSEEKNPAKTDKSEKRVVSVLRTIVSGLNLAV